MIEFPSCFKGTSPNQAYISTGSVRTEQGKIPTMLDDFYLVSSGDFFNDFYWENNIHPYIKHKQAMRLSKMVLATGNYDSKYDIDYVAGPIFVSENFTDNTFTTVDLKFDHVGDGLVNHDEEGIGIWGLEVLVNGEWIEASGAQITANDTVTVTADARIDGVRYHRATDSTFPTWATLSNSENIPCAAFVKYFHKFENLWISQELIRNGHKAAVIYLGNYYNTDNTAIALVNELKQNGYTKHYPFLENIKEEDIVRSAGSEFYYLVFAETDTKITVSEFIFNDTDEYYREIYSDDSASSIVLCGNVSDIIPNLKIEITDSKGTVTEYVPFISLKDGSVSTDDNGDIVDYTIYHLDQYE